MFWIYLSPVILVAALAALVVIIGKKSAALKKSKLFQAEPAVSKTENSWKIRLKSIGAKILQWLEKLLVFIKFLFNKIELIISGWALKLRARRSGRKSEGISLGDKTLEEKLGFSDSDVKIVDELKKTEDISHNLKEEEENIRYSSSEIVVRKKLADRPVTIPKKEPLPEDKVRESALIYRIAESPKDLEAYRELGDYYMGIGNIRDAKESFKMVLKLRPRDLKARSSLREIEMKMRLGS